MTTAEKRQETITCRLGVYSSDNRRTNLGHDLALAIPQDFVDRVGKHGARLTRRENVLTVQLGDFKYAPRKPRDRAITLLGGADLLGLRIPGDHLGLTLPRPVAMREVTAVVTNGTTLNIELPQELFNGAVGASEPDTRDAERKPRRAPKRSVPGDYQSELRDAVDKINKAVDKGAVTARVDVHGHVRLKVQVEI